MHPLKSRVVGRVDALRQEAEELSLRIHTHPELAFEEFQAQGWLSQYLEEKGFSVERGIGELPTAFRARYGSGEPQIAFLAEYDALPKLGHACGHNIIAAAAVAAATATKAAVEELGGCIVVMGTPGEETGGGKGVLVDRGAFQGLDVAMMVHPGVRNTVIARSVACLGLKVEFFGRAAHASARPEDGINALEALILSFNAIDSLRQHIRDRARIHGIVTDGGEAPNIVPAYAAASFLVRAEEEAYLEELREKVLNCFLGAALATGARLEHEWATVRYAAMRSNQALAEAFADNLRALGREVQPPNTNRGTGSTDMGNVSLVVPSIHPSIAIAPREVAGHTPEFALAAASEEGHRGLLDGAKAMAMTAVDLLTTPQLLSRIREEFCQGSGEESKQA